MDRHRPFRPHLSVVEMAWAAQRATSRHGCFPIVRRTMSDIDQLFQRYVEDRSSLSVRELDELIAALRADPDFAVAVREQLLVDDLLAQKFTIDRRNFVAQVEQRIA